MSAVVESTIVGAQPLQYRSDEDLISRLRANDEDAFGELVGRYERQLLSFCRRMLGSLEDAEDILQDTFAAAYEAILADERVIEARPWLFKIARNRCLNAIRGRRPTLSLGVGGLEREALTGTAEQVARRVELNLIVNDILALPAQQREALVLHELEGCSYQQIARHLGTSVASVRSLLLRARKSLLARNEARSLPCAEVRARIAESSGISAAIRRHLHSCAECARYRSQLRRRPVRVLRAISPVGTLLALKNFLLGRILNRASSQATAGAGGAGAAATASAGGAATTGAGLSAAAAKTLVALAALAAAGTGTVALQHATTAGQSRPRAAVQAPSAVAPAKVSTAGVARGIAAAPPPSRPSHARSPAASKAASTSQTPPPAAGAPPSQPPGSGSSSSAGSQSTSGLTTPTAPPSAARTRPLSGSGAAPVRTRPRPGATSPHTSSNQDSSNGASSARRSRTRAERHRQPMGFRHRHGGGGRRRRGP